MLTIAGTLTLGSGGTSTLQEGAGGSLSAQNVNVNSNALNLGANDSVNTLTINNGTVTTTAVGNVTNTIYFVSGTLNLGANMNLRRR